MLRLGFNVKHISTILPKLGSGLYSLFHRPAPHSHRMSDAAHGALRANQYNQFVPLGVGKENQRNPFPGIATAVP